jgi:hypothetical protein
MKRVLLAIGSGFLIPFLYAVVTGPLSNLVENYWLHEALYIPIGWPRLFLQRVLPLGSFPFRDGDATTLLFFMIVCNIGLYGCLSYFFFWWLSQRKRAHRETPPPPNFG